MASRDLIAFLLQATLLGSAAIGLVLALRQPLQRAFGARVAYAAWWLVPAAMSALLLPAAAPVVATGMAGGGLSAPARAVIDLAGRDAGFQWQAWALIAWIAGGLVAAAMLARAQARFRGALGTLLPHGDAWRPQRAVDGLPATFGVFAPRIVVPVDFESRYDAAQRELMLAHERAHVARGDLHANLLAAALRCLFWFNPLFHLAMRRFRHDQELACDATVVAGRPHQRRAYGDALFRAQLAAHASPLGCHFGFGHPLKERIAMLKEPLPTPRRRIAGHAAVATLVLGAAFAAWAAQPPVAQDAATIARRDVASVALAPPTYPKTALEQGISGKVVLIVDVAADGSVAAAKVERADPAGVFDASALETVKKWRFTPATKDGKPVASRIRVPIEWRADGEAG
jgi:TonB family protein